MKRAFDIVVSGVGLLLVGPLMLGIAVAVKATSRGAALYRGERIGLNGVAFEMLKFRTMVADAEQRGGSSTPQDDPRITPLGRILRRWKLDELPQLFNVLKGEMSLVGPRPQVRWAVDLYGEEERRLLNVRPGITDWASIRFRDEAAILEGSDDPDRDYLEKIAAEKIRLGLKYVDEHSVTEDLKILAATFRTVLKA